VRARARVIACEQFTGIPSIQWRGFGWDCAQKHNSGHMVEMSNVTCQQHCERNLMQMLTVTKHVFRISVGFFQDILVPPHFMPVNAVPYTQLRHISHS
jgi:hypothetical protein